MTIQKGVPQSCNVSSLPNTYSRLLSAHQIGVVGCGKMKLNPEVFKQSLLEQTHKHLITIRDYTFRYSMQLIYVL